jgi:hypothetical protein
MRNSWWCLLLVLTLCGCDVKTGHFCANGEKQIGSSSHVASLAIINGCRAANGLLGENENLLYLMIVCPTLKLGTNESIGGGIEGDPMATPLIYNEWQTTSGEARVTIEWNTRSDSVSIGQKEFNRTAGNVFFIVRKATGELVARQCGMLGPNADFSDLIQLVRRTSDGDELVRSVKFDNLN